MIIYGKLLAQIGAQWVQYSKGLDEYIMHLTIRLYGLGTKVIFFSYENIMVYLIIKKDHDPEINLIGSAEY
jgi:hypothetical protein